MSFIIAVHVGEGIVLASDSRTTYNKTENQNGNLVHIVGVHTTDSTDKTFLCPNKCGISTCGDASINGMPITGYIQSFIRENIIIDTDITQVPQLVLDYFRKFNPIPNSSFIVAGYTKVNETLKQKIYKINISQNTVVENDTESPGATWDGEVITLIRLLNEVALKNTDGTYSDLQVSEVLWNLFTLQDAVNFAKYAVEVTINTMHFQNVVETVGGSVDILVLKPEETFWLSRKQLMK